MTSEVYDVCYSLFINQNNCVTHLITIYLFKVVEIIMISKFFQPEDITNIYTSQT